VLRLAGEIDLSCADDVVGVGRDLLAAAPTGATLVIDLAGVEFADSSALNALVRLRNLAVESRVSPVLRDVPPVLVSLLELTGLTGVFAVVTGESAPDSG
jgi:anti-anti-sigma factor